MKRFSFKFGVAILTFVFGICAVWLYLVLNPNEIVCHNLSQAEHDKLTPNIPAQKGVRVNVKNIEIKQGVPEIYVEIINESSETLYYRGRDINDILSFKTQFGNKIQETMFSVCINSFPIPKLDQTLPPGEKMYYLANNFFLNRNQLRKINRLGFTFEVGEEKRYLTVWTESFDLSKLK